MNPATSPKPFSLTYFGVIVSVVGFLLTKLGVPYAEGELVAVLSFVMNVGGALVALYGRFRKGDVQWFGAKKE